MSPDELKMIMDAVSAVSGDAASVAKYWIILHYAIKVLVVLVGGAVVTFIAARITKAIGDATESRQILAHVASQLGCDGLYLGSYSSRREFQEAINKLKAPKSST